MVSLRGVLTTPWLSRVGLSLYTKTKWISDYAYAPDYISLVRPSAYLAALPWPRLRTGVIIMGVP